MQVIEVETIIKASIERCFDLCLNVDLHQESAKHTGEKIIAGIDQGVLKLGDEVTWKAKHFGVWQELSVKIVELKYPVYFCDEMQKGAFKSMKHEHYFYDEMNKTIMKDIFKYEVPYGIFGKVFDSAVLYNHMVKFLKDRCEFIKRYAEANNIN